jgi:hypothetical protein
MTKNIIRFIDSSEEIPFSQEELDVIFPFRGQFKELLEEEPLYLEILDLHLCYRNEVSESPILRDGIRFYSVGHNASHEFYTGAKGGKRFKLACGPSGESEECIESIHEVQTGDWGYIGHY